MFAQSRQTEAYKRMCTQAVSWQTPASWAETPGVIPPTVARNTFWEAEGNLACIPHRGGSHAYPASMLGGGCRVWRRLVQSEYMPQNSRAPLWYEAHSACMKQGHECSVSRIRDSELLGKAPSACSLSATPALGSAFATNNQGLETAFQSYTQGAPNQNLILHLWGVGWVLGLNRRCDMGLQKNVSVSAKLRESRINKAFCIPLEKVYVDVHPKARGRCLQHLHGHVWRDTRIIHPVINLVHERISPELSSSSRGVAVDRTLDCMGRALQPQFHTTTNALHG